MGHPEAYSGVAPRCGDGVPTRPRTARTGWGILLGVGVGDGGEVEREHVDGDGGEDEDDADPELPVLVGALPVRHLLLVRLFWAGVVVTVVGVLSFGHGGVILRLSACVCRLSARVDCGSEPAAR